MTLWRAKNTFLGGYNTWILLPLIYVYILLKAEVWHLLLLSSCYTTSSPRHSLHNYYLLFIPFFKKII